MKKVLKRCAAFCLAVCLISALYVPPVAAKAGGGIQQALEEVEEEFPDGSYFTTDGQRGSPNSFFSVAKSRNVSCKGFSSNAWLCLAYAKFVWASVFGLEATEDSNRTVIGAGRAGVVDTWKNAKPGDLIYFYADANLSSWKHAGIYLGKNGNTISLVDCNYKGSNKIAYYSVTCGQGGWPYSYVRVYRAKNYQTLDVQYTITFDAEGGSVYPTSITVPEGSDDWKLPTPTRNGYTFKGWCLGEIDTGNCIVSYPWTIIEDMDLHAMWVKEGCASHNKNSYKTVEQNGKYTAVCKTCGEAFVLGSLDTSVKGTYQPTGSYVTLCSAPYEKANVDTRKGKVQIVGAVKNAYDSIWYKTSDGYWIYAEYLEKTECTSHTKGSFLFSEASHPHYNYYECANCGARFTDGTKGKMDNCTTCNPPKNDPVWSEWSSWSTNAVSATSTRQVETRQVKVSNAYTEYRYGRYVSNGHDCWCKTYLASRPYYNGSIGTDYSSWSTTRYKVYDSGWTCGQCNGKHSGYYETDSQGREFWYEYKINGKSYYWEESRTVSAQYRTEYRYRVLE